MKILPIYLIMLLSSATLAFGSCGPDDNPATEQPPAPTPAPNPDPDDPNPPVTGNKGIIKVAALTFEVTFFDNTTANAFKQLLPMTVDMTEHAGNEKYYNLSHTIPSNHTNPGTIQNGDIMLYSSSTLVLFYKTFSTSYRYTRIGKVNNPAELQTALGTGSVTVTFEMQ